MSESEPEGQTEFGRFGWWSVPVCGLVMAGFAAGMVRRSRNNNQELPFEIIPLVGVLGMAVAALLTLRTRVKKQWQKDVLTLSGILFIAVASIAILSFALMP